MKNRLSDALLDLIFPRFCISCKTEGSFFCSDCIALVPLNTRADPLSSSGSLSGLIAAAPYSNPILQRAIKLFKYPPFVKELASPLTFIIISHLTLINKPEISPHDDFQRRQRKTSILCPIPLDSRRLRWRGFNHAELLANHLSETLNMPVEHLLLKTKRTKPQAELSEQKRSANIQGAFSVASTQDLTKKRVILVDDVYTTGSTMEEAAKALRKAGASSVLGLVVARG